MNKEYVDLRRRSIGADTWSYNLSQEPISDGEQALLDRHMFDLLVQRGGQQRYEMSPPVVVERYFNPEDARELIDELAPQLDKSYGWLAGSDPTVVARLLNEVEFYRQEFKVQHGELPLDRQIYLHYRELFDGADPEDDYPREAVRLLDALMNGNIKNGTIGDIW